MQCKKSLLCTHIIYLLKAASLVKNGRAKPFTVYNSLCVTCLDWQDHCTLSKQYKTSCLLSLGRWSFFLFKANHYEQKKKSPF